MEGVQHTTTDWWAISVFSTQLLKCNSIHEIEDAAKVTVNEPKTPDGACYLELKVPSRSRRDEKLLEVINTPLEAVQRIVSSCHSPLMQGTQPDSVCNADPDIITNRLTRAFSTRSWSHSYKSWEKTYGVVPFIRRASLLQMVSDMRRTHHQVLYARKAGGARYPMNIDGAREVPVAFVVNLYGSNVIEAKIRQCISNMCVLYHQ
ncbi:DNA-directed RNA polymerases IV and V subunit 2-like protein, partial [Tanacetum coccineum]